MLGGELGSAVIIVSRSLLFEVIDKVIPLTTKTYCRKTEKNFHGPEVAGGGDVGELQRSETLSELLLFEFTRDLGDISELHTRAAHALEKGRHQLHPVALQMLHVFLKDVLTSQVTIFREERGVAWGNFLLSGSSVVRLREILVAPGVAHHCLSVMLGALSLRRRGAFVVLATQGFSRS